MVVLNSSQLPIMEEIVFDSEKHILCRLCHQSAENKIDIFVTSALQIITKDNEVPATMTLPSSEQLLIELIQDLLKIEYENHELLPRYICDSCADMIRTFYKYRCYLEKLEEELRVSLQEIKRTHPEYRPGLNGNPGNFEPEPNCEIIDVDPEKDCYESSDDEFTSDSGTDIEEATVDDEECQDGQEKDGDEEEQSNISQNTTKPLLENINAVASTSKEVFFNQEQLQQTPAQAYAVTHLTTVAGVSETSNINRGGAATGIAYDGHPKNTYLCQFCDLAFTRQIDCHEHELHQHDPALPFTCSFCQMRLSSRQILISHIREKHNQERPYVCVYCNKGFVRRSDLKKHTIVHTGVRPYSCVVCTKSFSRNTNLTKHMRIHSSIKPFVCQVCPRSFVSAMDLMQHTRTHSVVKPFQCNRCSSSFTRKVKLNIHLQMHARRDAEMLPQQQRMLNTSAPTAAATGVGAVLPNVYNQHNNAEKEVLYQNSNFSAQLQQQNPATKSIAQRSTQHGRAYNCEICQKKFQRERDLQRHKALHMDKLFTCKQCGKGFNRREKLLRHESQQHGPQYPCQTCGVTFSRTHELSHHMKMHDLQQNVALNTQAALNAVAQTTSAETASLTTTVQANEKVTTATSPSGATIQQQRPSADELFYSNMLPTMNLGFYSET